MTRSKLRRQIAWQAAKLMYDRQESEYYRAKMKASRLCCKGWVKPKDLPSNAEIRDEIQNMARMLEGEKNHERLLEMRLEAIRMMRILSRFRTRLIGSVLTGHIRQGSDIDIHVFCDSLESITGLLDSNGVNYEVERKRVVKAGERQIYEHVHVKDRFEIELTVYPTSKSSFVFKSSITGKPIERASEAQLLPLMEQFYPCIDIEERLQQCEEQVDPFQLYYALLLPLENVKQHPSYHPEGDALYHSLQVYDLACDAQPYDEEFLLAALLHDIGKAIDPHDHVQSGLIALEGFVTDRTRWLIENHMLAHQLHDHTIGARKRKRLQENESFDDLVLLGKCDREGRKQGIETTELEDALDYIRTIGSRFG
jgi:predicted nucleotidyltransferase